MRRDRVSTFSQAEHKEDQEVWRSKRTVQHLYHTGRCGARQSDQQPVKMKQDGVSTVNQAECRQGSERKRFEIRSRQSGSLSRLPHWASAVSQAECRQRGSGRRGVEIQEQTETFRDPGAETFRDPGADRHSEIREQTETFRDPGADRDIQRSRSRQRHSETQEQTVTFRDPEADRNIQRSRCGQHGG